VKLNSIFILLILFETACNEIKIDKSKWLCKEDIEYPYRKTMLKDLTTNYKIKGLSYKQLIGLLGEPGNIIGNNNEAYYPIMQEYGSDIDPIHTINLSIRFSQDSIVTDFKIDEWKKNK